MNIAAIFPPLTERPAWKALETHYQTIREVHLRQLFADDPQRGEHLSAEALGLYLDYSKNRITSKTLNLLLQLAENSGLRARIDAMFRGEMINVTEKRAVLHVALRAPKGSSILVDSQNVVPQVRAVLDKMTEFAHSALGYRPPAPEAIKVIPRDPGYAKLRQDLWLDLNPGLT